MLAPEGRAAAPPSPPSSFFFLSSRPRPGYPTYFFGYFGAFPGKTYLWIFEGYLGRREAGRRRLLCIARENKTQNS